MTHKFAVNSSKADFIRRRNCKISSQLAPVINSATQSPVVTSMFPWLWWKPLSYFSVRFGFPFPGRFNSRTSSRGATITAVYIGGHPLSFVSMGGVDLPCMMYIHDPAAEQPLNPGAAGSRHRRRDACKGYYASWRLMPPVRALSKGKVAFIEWVQTL